MRCARPVPWLAWLLLLGAALAAHAVGPRPPAGQEDVVSGDDPVYPALQALAARGYFADAGRRQFEGHGVLSYTRRQLVDFLVPTLARLTDTARAWPVQHIRDAEAAELAGVVERFRQDLLARGVDVGAAEALLRGRRADAVQVLPSASAGGRLGTGRETLTGRAEASLFATANPQLRGALTVSTEGTKAFPDNRDRTTLKTAFVEYDPSRHLELGLGRRAWRYGPGYHDMLWSDNARPPDHFNVRWDTKLFNRPFAVQEQMGTFSDAGLRQYVAIRRLELEPIRDVTLAWSETLITDRFTQFGASAVIPYYFARFVAGPQHAGGHGNFNGQLDLAWRLRPEWAMYGQLFADDFDFSPSPPKTVQRLGWLGGLHYTPRWALPGSDYRLEVAVLPDPGTYTGQSDPGLSWTHHGIPLGHLYGADAFGFRVSARHRFNPRLDVAGSYEFYRQLRSQGVVPRAGQVELSADYDLTHYCSVGLGFSHLARHNMGAVLGRDRVDDSFFVEMRAGY